MKSLQNYLPCIAIGGLLLFGTLLPGTPATTHPNTSGIQISNAVDKGFFIIRTKWVRAPRPTPLSATDIQHSDHLLARYGQ